jgi:ferrous iron transport protein B
MMHEAAERGITVDADRLSARLGVPVVPTVAIWQRGLTELRAALRSAQPGHARVRYPEPVERAVSALARELPPSAVTPRSLALLLLATIEPHVAGLPLPLRGGRTAVEDARHRLARELPEPPAYAIHEARRGLAVEIALEAGAAVPLRRRVRRVADRLEPLTTHPVWGYPILAAILALAYLFVGRFGAGTLVDFVETNLFEAFINPGATRIIDTFLPVPFVRDLLVGPYGVITMALTYAIAIVLPVVITFFTLFGILEDSGYLPRLAVMLHRTFRRMGLNGKAVLPMVLGLGCDTMATLTTRVLETKKERMIVTILLALGIPCSAQLGVIMAMLGRLGPSATFLWLGVTLATIFLVGFLASKVVPGNTGDFIVELPPMRVPRASNILIKVLARTEWYLKEAVPLFVLGTLLLYVLDVTHLLATLQRALSPLVVTLLGLPAEASNAFVIGFLRRDYGAAGLFAMQRDGALNATQTVVALTVITLFIPCIASFLVMIRERGKRAAFAIAAFVTAYAFGIGALLNWILP